MTPKLFADRTVQCSFCAKPEAEVGKLIAGPGVYICDDCVRLCESILAQAGLAGRQTEIPVAEGMTDDEVLALLPQIASVSAQVEASLQTWVDRLRSRGVSWSRIGEALGVTRQSAWGRFSGEE
jgi:hypothetical protein